MSDKLSLQDILAQYICKYMNVSIRKNNLGVQQNAPYTEQSYSALRSIANLLGKLGLSPIETLVGGTRLRRFSHVAGSSYWINRVTKLQVPGPQPRGRLDVPRKHGRKLLTRIKSSGGCKTLTQLIVALGVLRFSQEGRGEKSNQQAS